MFWPFELSKPNNNAFLHVLAFNKLLQEEEVKQHQVMVVKPSAEFYVHEDLMT